DAVVVLTEDADPVPELRKRRDQAAAALGGYVIQEEVGECKAGECSCVLEVAKDALVARVRKTLTLVQPAAAELELVTAFEQRELLGELVALDVVELRPTRVSEAKVADIERAQAGDRLVTWDADRRVGLADARPVSGNGLELHVSEADQQLIEGGRPQRARPVEGQA